MDGAELGCVITHQDRHAIINRVVAVHADGDRSQLIKLSAALLGHVGKCSSGQQRF